MPPEEHNCYGCYKVFDDPISSAYVTHYKDGYCKDCYIRKLERENERLKAQVAHHKNILANPPIIY